MTDLLLVLLINFFALYTTSQYLAVLKKEEQKKTWRCLLPHFLLWCVLNTCCISRFQIPARAALRSLSAWRFVPCFIRLKAAEEELPFCLLL